MLHLCSDRLKNERKKLKLTQQKLALLLDVSDMTIKRWETGATAIPSDKLILMKNLGFDAIKNPLTLEELLQKPDVKIAELISIDPRLNDIEEDVAYQVELNVKYRGYIERQNEMVKRTKRLEDIRIPPDLVYRDISGISNEIATEETFLKFKADMQEIENMKLEIAKEEILQGL